MKSWNKLKWYQTCISDRKSIGNDGERILVVSVAVEPMFLLKMELESIIFPEKFYH